MSDDDDSTDSSTSTSPTATTPTTTEAPPSNAKAQSAIESLSSILNKSIPSSISSSNKPAYALLHDPTVSSQISSLLRLPDSGAGDNNLCRWLYDTFQSTDSALQLVVLRFLPTIAGVYLSRVPLRKPQAGFEAVLLALYAHETTSRGTQSITVNIPDLSHPSIYHESKIPVKSNATDLNIAVISPTLEPHGTVRSTKRARIVGVALELYYSKISEMPSGSKLDFCEFCEIWSGQDGDMYKEGAKHEDGAKYNSGKKEGRIPLPWELLQPVLRILGNCLLGLNRDDKTLFGAASSACRSLYGRSLHDINPKSILATGSLLRLGNMASNNNNNEIDYTEITNTAVITV